MRIGLIAAGAAIIGIGAYALMGGDGPGTGTGGEVEPSRCLSEATIALSTAPAQIALGQTSVVKWHVGSPTGCGNVHVRFSGLSVGVNGSRIVTPSRTSTFTVIVSETHLGVYGQKSKSTTVGVTYPPRVVIGPGTRDPAVEAAG